MKRSKVSFKIAAILLVLLGLSAAMLVLNHRAQKGRRTTERLPQIVSEPVYVECEEGSPLGVTLRPREDFSISGFRLLLVNLSEESRGTVRVAASDGSGALLVNQVIPAESITPGKWFTVPADISFAKGEEYSLSILADGSEPYFMQVTEGGDASLPFDMSVTKEGEAVTCGISLGVSVVEEVAVTYGEILYYSVPVSILTAVILIVCILFGWKRVWECIRRIPLATFLERYGNDLFLLLLYLAVCVSIYSRAYLKGVYISADSAGYLREAVNLVNGNGFGYDQMAGYHSWFANWPILYPAMIAAVMLVTKVNAYLASKILTMLLVGILLLLMRFCFKKDAWVYALSLTNIGFLNLAYYTWSEIPFMLFMLGFSLTLAKILGEKKTGVKWYFLLGTLGVCCFLTRYFGIYVWMVAGCYILYLLWDFWKNKNRETLLKAAGLTATAFLAGCFSMAYLFVNKCMNGMASGVSRTLWWDDYEKLTNDLIESLLIEIFNTFSLQVPERIEGFPYHIKVFVLAVFFVGIVWFVIRSGWKEGGGGALGKTWDRQENLFLGFCSREFVLLAMGTIYYLVFIVIRYFSSMDTFYFRFFEPASFLIFIGLAGMALPRFRSKSGFRFFGGAVTALILLSVISVYENGGMDTEDKYFDQLSGQWDEAYREIPEKSVVIFNDIDFRSSWYRPDVIEGTISPLDTFEGIRETYYGSEYLCLRREFAEVMLESGEYGESIEEKLRKALDEQEKGREFVVISLQSQNIQ